MKSSRCSGSGWRSQRECLKFKLGHNLIFRSALIRGRFLLLAPAAPARSAENRRTRGHPGGDPPETRDSFQRARPLVEVKGANVLADDLRHGHTQRGREVLL